MPNNKTHYLFTILNWGLGHAARCVPIIRLLVQADSRVSLASDGRAYYFLKKEFPDLNIYTLPSYNIRYSPSGSSLKLASQLLKLPSVIKAEKAAVSELVKSKDVDVIISDNRYGGYNHKTKNVFICHQLFLKAPFKSLGSEFILNKVNEHYISKFDELWIPDIKGQPNLSGDLSHKKAFTRIPHFFIGPISHFKKNKCDIEYDIGVVLSGPEPQRSILESNILLQVKNSDHKVIIVRGVSEGDSEIRTLDNRNKTSIVDFLNSRKLNELILKSEVVIARSGYTTLMDMVLLEKPVIFIPTPGQTEQIYLAKRLKENGIYYYSSQDEFSLENALTSYKKYANKMAVRNGKQILESRLDALNEIKSV